MRSRGKFIVLEGADGAGTTTQTNELVQSIFRNGGKAVAGHTPSELDIGKFTRSLITGFKVKDWRVMMCLFYADMIDYTQKFILPHLDDGFDVICDRYYPSTLVYQSSHDEPYTRKDAGERMEHMYDEMMGLFMYESDPEWGYPLLTPDAAIYLTMRPQELEKRVKDRGGAIDAYEGSEQRKRLVDLYDDWFFKKYDPCLRFAIYGGRPIEEISEGCYKIYSETIL